jgi:hypothetical protein
LTELHEKHYDDVMKSTALAMLVAIILLITAKPVLAQSVSGVANSMIIQGENIQNGDIICEGEDQEGFGLCKLEYNPKIYGVVVDKPSVGLISDTATASNPVTTSGNAQVRVSSMNGAIKVGDYITSSTKPGVGQKATRSGYALGVAQSEWNSTNPDEVGLIQVSIQPKPAILTSKAGSNLLLLIKEGLDASYLSPVMALRYVLASLITIASIVLGFWFFARSAHSGIQAIGRNPLAGKSIQLSIFLNVVITLGVMGVGLFVAYLLLVF